MEIQKLIFSVLASSFCICLGTFSLFQAPKSKVARLFAFFNYCNALWNIGEFVVLFNDVNVANNFERFTGIGGCFFITFVLGFVYELIGITEKSKIVLGFAYLGSVVFSILNLFSPILRGGVIEFDGVRKIQEVPGPLFPFFSLFLIIILIALVIPLPKEFKTADSLKRRQISYIFLAWVCGFFGLLLFLISEYTYNFTWTYHPLQVFVSFIFSYAIFKHELIPVKIALRRASLIVGIYVVIGILFVPVIYWGSFYAAPGFPLPQFIGIIVLAGIFFSMGPLVYAFMVKRSALFQEVNTSHLAHEFKSPLAAIRSAHDILDGKLKNLYGQHPGLQEYMEMVDRNTGRLEKFVTEILDLIKLGDKNKAYGMMEELNLNELIKDVVDFFPNARDRVSIYSSSSLTIRGIREGLEFIFFNLISNAEKYAPDGPIKISLEKDARMITATIEDQGRGILPEDLERIFVPFARGKEIKKGFHGTGLGLAIVRKWVEVHGGKVWAESKGVNKGSIIHVQLPK